MAKKSTTNSASTKPSTGGLVGKSLSKRLAKITGVFNASVASDGTAADVTEWIDTGSHLFNMQISGDLFKGLPVGNPIEFVGDSGTGKTYFMLSLVDSFQKNYENAHISIFDTEKAHNQDRLKARNLDMDRIAHIPVEDLNQLRTSVIKTLDEINDPENQDIYEGSRIMLMIDSIGQPPSKKEMEDARTGNDVAAMGERAKLIRSIFRIIGAKQVRHKITVVIANHLFRTIGGYGDARKAAGGDGHIFFCDNVFMLSVAQHKEGEVRVGNIITVRADKARDTKSHTKTQLLLSYQYGLHRHYGLADWAVQAGLWKDVTGGYEINGVKVSEKKLYQEAETYFTKEVMDKLNVYMKPFFSYGESKDDALFQKENEPGVEPEEKAPKTYKLKDTE